MAVAAGAVAKKKGWFRKKNADGTSSFRDQTKWGLGGGLLAWFALDPNAGSKVGGLVGNAANNTADAAGGLLSPFMNPSSSSFSSLVSLIMVAILIPVLMKTLG